MEPVISDNGPINQNALEIYSNDDLIDLTRFFLDINRQFITNFKCENIDQMITLLTKIDPNAKELRQFDGISMKSLFLWIRAKREKQLINLLELECCINMACSNSARIKFSNSVDLDGPPMNFNFINRSIAGRNVCISQFPPIGCECRMSCLSPKCCSKEGGMPGYTRDGRLKVPVGTPIYECNSRCSCTDSCKNRVLQKGRTTPVEIFKTVDGRGWGLRALQKIKRGKFVTEYVGEVIKTDEAEKRGQIYKDQNYFFDLDFNGVEYRAYTIDATRYGNESRFVNHSCNPNLVVFAVWVNCLDRDIPRLGFFASRTIEQDEELTVDYMCQVVRKKNRKSTPIIKNCRCGARNCRKDIK